MGVGVDTGFGVGFGVEAAVGDCFGVVAGFGLETEAVEAVGVEEGAGAETATGSVSDFVSVFTDDILFPFAVLPVSGFLLSPDFTG